MDWLLSYVGSTVGLISVTGLSFVALAAIAVFTRNWKAGVAAIIVLAAGFAYMHIDKQAYQRRVSEEAAAQVALLRGRLETLQKQGEAHAERAKIDAAYIDLLESEHGETPANATPGIPADVAKRIGAIR